MSDTTHPKFTGRTYGRPRICQASDIFDKVVSDETASVTVKELPSLRSKGSSVYECESDDMACAPKKGRFGLQNDPSRFDIDDSKGQPMKMQHKLQEEKFHTQKTEMVTMPSRHRHSPSSLVVAAPSFESGMKASSATAACFSQARFVATNVNGEENDDLSINLPENTPKTDFREVIVDEKPNPSLLKKFGHRRQQTARNRRPLTVCASSLSENNHTNSTNKLLTEKLNPLLHESNKTVIPPNHDLASEKQDATVPVSKYTSQLVMGERQAKYFLMNSEYKLTFSETMSDASQEDSSATCSSNSVSSTALITGKVSPRKGCEPQNAVFMEDNSLESMSTQEIVSTNGSNYSALSSTVSTEGIPAKTGSQLQNVLFMEDNSSQQLSSPASDSSIPLSPPLQCVTKSGNYSPFGAEPSLQLQASLSHDDNCLLINMPQTPAREQYRIFKSRSAKVQEKLKSQTFKQKELDGLSLSSRKVVLNASGDSQVSTPVKAAQFSSPASFISTQESNSAEPTVKYKFKLNCQHVDFSSAGELHAAQLHHIKHDRDSDSVSSVGDVWEFTEPSSSQETPSNSQKSLRRNRQNSSSYAVTGWKFFKSKKSLSQSVDVLKSKSATSSQKVSAKTSYFIRSWNIDHGEDIKENKSAVAKKKKKKNDETDVVLHKSEEGQMLKRVMHWPVGIHDKAYTTLTVSKSHKELYTVIQNVRQTHEVQELGETHDFIKEVDYLLESLKDTNSTTIRCLSCLKLASKCISPAFRMHMRVHGTVTRIFNLLQDACSDPSLALTTSAIMFILSRDRLSMDLDQPGLRLMLQLSGDVAALEDSSMQALEKTRLKVKELLGLLQKSYSSEVDLDFVSTSSLALESLLSLTSRRAGEWFKQELRSVGGLDHIVDSVTFCEENLPEDLSRNIQKSLPVLSKLNRYLKVLENISYMNPENDNYLFSYRNSVLLQSCSRTLRKCQSCLSAFKLPENLDSSKAVKDLPGYTILTCMLSVLMLMINVTHGNRLASLEVASLMETVVQCLTVTVYCIPVEQRFDLAVQCLVLLTNLVEHQEKNRQMFMDMRMQVRRAQTSLSRIRTVSAVSAIVELFVQREQAAREMEEEIDSISDTSASPSPSPRETLNKIGACVQQATCKQKRLQKKQKTLACDISAGKIVEHQQNQSILDGDETFTKALHKAGKHMENSIVAAYAAIFLGSVIADNKNYISAVKKLLPNGDFGPMVTVLTKFHSFMALVTSNDHADVRLIERVIEVLSSA
ncbi:hypothetical protein BsWGS_06757 [Bradybaena similaris]